MLEWLISFILTLWLLKHLFSLIIHSDLFLVNFMEVRRNAAVFITGCDSGFGAALARLLDSRGTPVFAGCLTEEGMKTLREGCSENLRTIQLDVTKEDSIANAVKYVKECLKNNRDLRLWGLVNNAGTMGSFLPIDLTSIQEFNNLMSVNYLGAVSVTKAFLHLIVESRGRIAITTSVQAAVPGPSLGAYTASKYALHAFSKVLQMEMQHFQTGVKVSTVQPSGFKTNLQLGVMEQRKATFDRLSEDKKAEYGRQYFDTLIDTQDYNDPKQTEILTTDLTPVAECFQHALFAQYPKEEYLVGKFCGTMHFMYKYLPTWLFNFIMVRLYDMKRPNSIGRNHKSL